MALKDDFVSGLSEIRNVLPSNAKIVTQDNEKYIVSCTTGKISDKILSGNSKLNLNSLRIKFLIKDLIEATEITSGNDDCPIKGFVDCDIIYRSVKYNVVDEKMDGNFDSEISLYVSRVG